MTEKELDKLNKDNYGFTMKEIDDDLGRYMIKYSDLLREKQQLIKFLESKIKEIENTQKLIINEHEINFTGKEIKLDLLNEILDFVNKGGKE